jgi:AcrR family transcriptional regulator
MASSIEMASGAIKKDVTSADLLGRRESRAFERRQSLIEAARTLFVAHGFHGAGIAQIAKLSGVAVGQIYRDFASKEDIVAAIVERDVAQFLEEATLRKAIDQGDIAAIRRWISDLVLDQADRQNARLLPEILAESSRNARIAAILRSADAQVRSRLLAALAAMVPDPEQAGLNAAADLILTVMTGLRCRDLASLQIDRASLALRMQAVIDREIGELLQDKRRE